MPDKTLDVAENTQDDIFCLDATYSTTRMVTTQRPTLDNHPDDAFESVLFLPEGEGRKGEGGLRTKGYFKRSQDDKPLVTVVTVVLNGQRYIEKTIRSVIGQTFNNIEFIVMDGGSTDGTIDTIKKYDSLIDYWVSEKDLGIYHAMNKGIFLSSGSVIGFLNSDDYLYTDTISKISNMFVSHKIDYTYGCIDLTRNDGKIFAKAVSLEKEQIKQRKFQGIPFPHPTVYVHKNWFKTSGVYNTRYKLSSDYDLMLRLIQSHAPSLYIKEPFGCFRLGGVSGGLQSFIENHTIIRDYGVNPIKAHYYLLKSLLKIALVNVLPSPVLIYLKKLRKNSNSQFYDQKKNSNCHSHKG